MSTDNTVIIDTPVASEMRDSFLAYAMSVVVSRALPDVRDGLKPVHRRILFGMAEANLLPSKGHVKCARVVGDVMGKYHPHGDSAIYEALVRMAQDFSMRLPLVDGHGNFGTQTDSPAAMRYCVTGDTDVLLADGSTRALFDIARDHGLHVAGEATTTLEVIGAKGERVTADRIFHSGAHPTHRVTTHTGHDVTGTGNHPLLVLDGADDGSRPPQLLWRTIEQLRTGDWVVLLREAAQTEHELSGHVPYLAAWLRANGDTTNHGTPELAVDDVASWVGPSPAIADTIPSWLRATATFLASGRYAYAQVTDITDAGVQDVYSLRIATQDHAFITNGIVSHNTECRMAHPAVAMTRELDEDTVDYRDTYDSTGTEPKVLPAAFPNLLVNGSEGIAVGMATKMAPHNLREVVAACRHYLRHPDASSDDLMVHVPAPDLPTGGFIVGTDGVSEAYRTGRGKFVMRARAEVTDVSARRKGIVVTELPYQVAPEKVIARIKELRDVKRLNGVSDVVDLSDMKNGLRLVIECKTGFDPRAVLAELYRSTPLQEGFSVHNLALVAGQPQTLSLRDLVHHYVTHRLEVTRRRCEHRRAKAQAQAHLLEGYLIALEGIDAVVKLIRSSKDTATARAGLMTRFALSETQASAILEMPLRRLTSLEVEKIRADLAALHAQIAELTRLLEDQDAMNDLVGDELDAVAAEFGTPRRTAILDQEQAAAADEPALQVPDTACTLTLSSSGLLARTGEASPGGRAGRHDAIVASLASTARASIGVVTSHGRLLLQDVIEVATVEGASRGKAVTDYVPLEAGEHVIALVDPAGSVPLALGTRGGVVKRLAPGEYPKKSGQPIIGLKEGDEVLSAQPCPDDAEVVFVTSDAQLLRFSATSVRAQGRTGGGMAGIKLADGAHVVGFGVASSEDVNVALASDTGSVKVTPLSAYPPKGRATGGVRCARLARSESALVAAITAGGDLIGYSATGALVKLPVLEPRRDGATQEAGSAVVGFGTKRAL